MTEHRSEGKASRHDVQSGDTQGLSRAETADSESVEELASEGQYLEADVVSGVQEAGDEPLQEVHTHQLLMDDVPREYLNDGSNEADPINGDESFESKESNDEAKPKKNPTIQKHPEAR